MTIPLLPGIGLPVVPLGLDSTFPDAIGDTYDFDFTAGDFVTGGGLVTVLTDEASLIQSLKKLLRTPRYRFLAYDQNYGNSFRWIIDNSGMTGEALDALLRGELTEALVSDPRVEYVTAATAALSGSALAVTATVVDTFGRSVSISDTVTV